MVAGWPSGAGRTHCHQRKGRGDAYERVGRLASASHWTPHRGDECAVQDRFELSDLDVALPLVAEVVAWIARLEVRGYSSGIPAGQVGGEVCLPVTVFGDVRTGGQQTQVGVRLAVGVVLVEPIPNSLAAPYPR